MGIFLKINYDAENKTFCVMLEDLKMKKLYKIILFLMSYMLESHRYLKFCIRVNAK